MAGPPRVICAGAELEEGGPGVRFEFVRGEHTHSAFVVRFDGVARAYLNQCAHVPMELDWQPGVFFDADGLYLMCSTHGAHYDAATGACAGGPCNGRGLRRVPVRETGGNIFLDE